jgi:hypothetical protein
MCETKEILYAGNPTKMIVVTGVKPLQDYRLLLTFSTDEQKIYDVSPLLELPVYRPLKEVAVFNDVHIDFETITWCNGDVDIAPETLYQESIPISKIKEA